MAALVPSPLEPRDTLSAAHESGWSTGRDSASSNSGEAVVERPVLAPPPTLLAAPNVTTSNWLITTTTGCRFGTGQVLSHTRVQPEGPESPKSKRPRWAEAHRGRLSGRVSCLTWEQKRIDLRSPPRDLVPTSLLAPSTSASTRGVIGAAELEAHRGTTAQSAGLSRPWSPAQHPPVAEQLASICLELRT